MGERIYELDAHIELTLAWLNVYVEMARAASWPGADHLAEVFAEHAGLLHAAREIGLLA